MKLAFAIITAPISAIILLIVFLACCLRFPFTHKWELKQAIVNVTEFSKGRR